jgi:hypothetical protein
MLTCAAIVLNAGPFTTAQNKAVHPDDAAGRQASAIAPANGSRPIARWDVDALIRAHHAAPSVVETEDVAARISALIRPSPFAAVGAAAAVPVDGGDLTGQPVPAWPTDPTAQTQPEHASVDPARDAIAGVWAPEGACSARDFRDGLLPTVINAEGAWAGETFCQFTNRKQTESGWTVVAKCTSPGERWTSRVRLTVNENRLTWTSRRGTQTYTRCPPDVAMAHAR